MKMKKVSEWTKKQKWILGITTLLVVGSVGTGAYKVHADSVKKKNIAEMNQKINQENKKISDVQKELSALYIDGTTYLVSGLSNQQLKDLGQKVKELTTLEVTVSDKKITASLKNQDEEMKRVKATYEVISYQLKEQEGLNKLFVNPALDGNKVNKDLAIADGATKEKVESILKENKQVENSSILDSDWSKSVNELKEVALNQLKQIDVATQKVNALFDKENVKGDVSQDAYNQAKGEVDKIKNEKAKKSLTDRLAKVAQKLEEKAQAEKQKAEAEQAQQAQATTNGGTVTENGTYSQNQSSSSNNYSESDYSSNAGGSYSSGNGGYVSSSGNSNQGSGATSGGSGNSSSGNSTTGTVTGGGSDGGGATWEGGTFNPGDLGMN